MPTAQPTPVTNQAPSTLPRTQTTPTNQAVKPATTPIVAANPVLKPLDPQGASKGTNMKKPFPIIVLVLVVLLLGAGTGYGLAVFTGGSVGSSGLRNEPGLQREVSKDEITVGTKVGVADERTFKDTAEGTLEKGGVDGEGSHHLVRPGGDSQTIYMTSSVIDLDQFVGRTVKVWGETFSAQKAGWLMDVGKLEVVK
ncbi:hypothetical protein GYA49_05645 [Candidatus Beckwithbacteria bacterium]|nr:hypothetical protein [Candidatus Beckwithbacteria bacterium]